MMTDVHHPELSARPEPARSRNRGRQLLLVGAAMALSCVACVSVGPPNVHRDRAAYNEVVVRSWNEQLLLNLVRLRYRDTPLFLEISSISTSYSLDVSASASGEIGNGRNDIGVGAGAGYAERPTVTYSPLSGEKFVKQLLKPIPLTTLFLLPQSGWSIERVLRCCVQRLNDQLNAPSASGPTPDSAPEFEGFHRTAELLRNLQRDRTLVLGIRRAPARANAAATAVTEAQDDGPRGPYVLRFPDESRTRDEVRELRTLLGIAQTDRIEMEFVPGTLERRPGELALVSRSLMGVMFYLSQAVAPPTQHEERGLVTVTRDTDGSRFDWTRVTGGLLAVHSGSQRPEEAFVAVPYRGAWFWIADNDLTSKSTFGLLTQLFFLQSGDRRALAPLLTLPVG